MAKQVPYIFTTEPHELDLQFYQRYDESFLYNKAVTLMYALSGGDQFKLQVENILQENGAGPLNSKYFESLRAELYFMTLHQFESFFALLIAPFQELPDWIYLTAYREDLRGAVQQFVGGRISGLTNGRFKNERGFIAASVYAGNVTADETQQARWDENLDNISWLVRRVARVYLDDLTAYNSYKHGLRVMTGTSYFALYLNDPAGKPKGPGFVRSSEDSLSFLEFEKNDKGKVVYETTKHFSPDLCLTYLAKMYQILETVKTTRLAALRGDTSNLRLNTFFNLDKDQIYQLEAERGFRISSTI